MSRLIVFLLAAHSFNLAAAASAQESKQLEKIDKSAAKAHRRYDSFSDKTLLKWKPVREDRDHWSLESHSGELTITTQRGTIHGDEKNDDFSGSRQAKNLFVIDSPNMGKGDFVLSTCLIDFQPTTHWQQAGLLLYNDDDNYVKFIFEYNGSAKVTTVLTEVEQKSNILPNAAPKDTSRVFLRIVRKEGEYKAQVSNDGMEYQTVQEFEWDVEGPSKVGLIAKNGGNPEAGEIEARFDFFELTWK